MNGKVKKSMRKVLPVGIAMGILFSASPVTEYKVKADVDTFGTIVTTFGDIYDAFLKEPFGKWLEEIDAKNSYAARLENVAYKAPTFNKGEFGISAFDFYKDKNFSKTVKLSYPNGKVEYKTIKHGQQIRIKDAGTIVDLTPDEPELSKHDILYITQKQLDEGNTGVSLTNFKTYYLTSNNSGGKNVLAGRFEQQEFPGYFLANGSGLRDVRYVNEDLFSKLPEEKRMLATITSEPVGKDVLSNYATNDPEAREDLKKRTLDVYTNHKDGEYSPISIKIINDGINLQAGDYVHEADAEDSNSGTDFTITPIKKGSNKVIISSVFNGKVRYLTSKSGDRSQWIYTHDGDISSDEIWDLVVRKDGQFSLKNNKGQYLYVPRSGKSAPAWTTGDINEASKLTARLAAHEWNNWLIDWHPRKKNETKKHEGKTYDGLEFKVDAKDGSIWTAYNSGKLITNSWIKRDNAHYYADSSGILLKGWQEIEGNTYYFNLNTNHRVSGLGTDSLIDGKYYNFNDDGVLQKSAWKGLYYSDASGALIKEGVKEIDNKIYYFKDSEATTNVLRLEDQGVTLRFSDEGVLMFVTGLDGKPLNRTVNVTLDNKTLPFGKDGVLEPLGISRLGNTVKYFSLEDGINYSGWKESGGEKYYFRDGKSSTVNGTETIDGKAYYFNDWGQATQIGFVDIDGIPFYLNDKAEKVTGVHEINGQLYLFSKGDSLRVYGEKVRNTIYRFDGKQYYTDYTGVISQNFKGYVYSNNRDYYIETNNEGVITKIWQK
ncbi:cell wall-binding protein [Bacillus cereus]|uniref:cell wall-binding protein n=1 Tax=Bacillus cereus TaxID=1396 RepID=UPI0018F3C47B|nr:cell wall-binding protein [Bacillus cereus]MBJ8009342.1 cell wall-binding protein [Bacillus cereus]WJE23274.1 cell wall-binding protein [Bacillus cereus]